MLFDFNFYSSLLLITFTQGIIYGLLLLKKGIQTEDSSNYWLSLFVFLCSFFVAPWMLGFAGWYDNQPYRDFMFYMPFQHLFFIGPIIYFYTQSLLNPSFKFDKKKSLHLLPGVLFLLYNLWIFIVDKIILKKYYYYLDGIDKDFEQWYQVSGQITMTLYFILSIGYYNRYKKLIVQIASNADSVLFRWIKNFLIAFLIMLLLPHVFDVLIHFFPSANSYKDDWWFYLVFSIVLYYIAVSGYSNSAHSKIGFEMSVFNSKPILLSTSYNTLANIENTIDIDYEEQHLKKPEEIENWKKQIETLIQSEQLFQNPELSLPEIAKKLQTNTSVISKAINQGFQMNFNDFINTYRIEAVKSMLINGEHKKSTLLGIAFDCGFNSKATFNRAFKKNTSLSPKEFIEKL